MKRSETMDDLTKVKNTIRKLVGVKNFYFIDKGGQKGGRSSGWCSEKGGICTSDNWLGSQKNGVPWSRQETCRTLSRIGKEIVQRSKIKKITTKKVWESVKPLCNHQKSHSCTWSQNKVH